MFILSKYSNINSSLKLCRVHCYKLTECVTNLRKEKLRDLINQSRLFSMAKTPIPSTQPLQSKGKIRKQKYRALIALPCCNEFDSLPETLKSLEMTAPRDYGDTLIIVNVNQRASMDNTDNLATLNWLQNYDTPLNLAWLDHVNGDAAYPEKFGVGLARHQCCTSGLKFIDGQAPVISLDADSPVNPEYLRAISPIK